MIDERTLELIHAELDDELDAEGRAELRERLQASPEATALRAELLRMSDALGRVPVIAPPPALHAQLLRPLRGDSAKVIPFPSRQARIIRYSLAFAAGMLLAMVGLSVLERPRSDFDPGALVGTMGRDLANPPTPVLADAQVAAPEIAGSVSLRQAGDHWLLFFDLTSAQPVQVSAAYDAAAFRLNGYAQGDAGVASFTAEPGRVGFTNAGAQRLALFLQPTAGGPIRVRLVQSGRVLSEATLDPSVAGARP